MAIHCDMSLEKVLQPVSFPCAVMLRSISDNNYRYNTKFEVSPSSIRYRLRIKKNTQGLIYNQVLSCDFNGMNPETFEILDKLSNDEYEVYIKYSDSNVFKISDSSNPMFAETRTVDFQTKITFENDALHRPTYNQSLSEDERGLPLTLTFSLT